MQQISFTHTPATELKRIVEDIRPDRIFILTDETTRRLCLPRLLEAAEVLRDAGQIVIGATDTHKTPESLMHVWQALSGGGASRHSLLKIGRAHV